MPKNEFCMILWDLPTSEIYPDVTVLSFLDPVKEHKLIEAGLAKQVATMSRIMDKMSPDARTLYLDLVADIGLYKLPDGRTFRKALAYESFGSSWWYHPVAFRNSEGDPTYTKILSILAIKRVAQELGINKLHLVKPPRGVSECLQRLFTVKVENAVGAIDWFDIGRALLGRVKWTFHKIQTLFALRRHYNRPRKKIDVAFQGFWDWSVFPNEGVKGQLSDRYFVNLPNELEKLEKSTCYWCTYSPSLRPNAIKRKNNDVLRPLKKHDNVVLLESLTKWSEIIKAVLDFRPLLVFFSIQGQQSFTETFIRYGLDFFPLFRSPLIRGFVSNSIPNCKIIESSVAKAFKESTPSVLLCFQEHFPPSRAMYAGLRGMHSKSWAVQHASYNQGKTYAALNPEKEFFPQSDGQSVPHPDKICVMGENGYKLFRSCGYSKNQVLTTGSPRYDSVRMVQINGDDLSIKTQYKFRKKVLVATSLPAFAEFQFVEAVVEAYKGLETSIALRLRAHPFGKMEEIPGYSKVKGFIEVTETTLEADLQWADLILISQSTVGEEAYLRGKLVWQFRYPNPNQSALAEVAPIKTFYTVTELQKAFINLASFSEISKPNQAEIEHVYRSLFQTNKEKPSLAIAKAICKEFY